VNHPVDAMRLISRIRFAQILSPEDGAEEQAKLAQRPKLPPYLIQASLPDDVVSKFERQIEQPLTPQFALFTTRCGAVLALVTIQAHGVQLRTVVPLVDEASKAWLDGCIAECRIAWLLEVHECRQAVLITIGCRFNDTMRLRSLITESRSSSSEMLALNLAQTTATLVETNALASLSQAQPIEEAYVLLVAQAFDPSEIRALADSGAVAPEPH
jgi:hypothetical protein